MRDDPLAAVRWIVDDDDDGDRLDAIGRASGGGATATRQLRELGAQIGVQPIEEPRADVAPFAWREAKAIVTPEGDVHPCADERPVAVCPSHCVTRLADHTCSKP